MKPIENSLTKEEQAKRERILEWTQDCFPLEVREEAILTYADYLRGRNNPHYEFYTQELVFGTGGMRGVIGFGAGRMNLWTIGRVSLALVNLLKQRQKHSTLVIAYDSRRMSKSFAQTTAGVAASKGVSTYLFREETPTPILSYAVRKLKAQAGVVITASHNPPEYNGYKVYNSQGAQIVGREQRELEKEIAQLNDWSAIPLLNVQDLPYKKHVRKVGAEIRRSYIQDIAQASFVSSPKNPSKKKLKIIYTPLHGTGTAWLVPLLKHYGFAVETVPEQAAPDGKFPTVKYPNPEEPEVLALAEKLALKRNADIFLATDPDADRLGAGVRNADSYTYLTGNQMGSIMCAFLCEKYATQLSPAIIYKTIVTTELQQKIAAEHNIQICNVLTGFKYIAEKIAKEESKKNGRHYLFGGEESFGYLPIDFVRDKDGLASALLLCEILAEVGNLKDYLDKIYMRYGMYEEELKSITLKGLDGQRQIQQLMERLRSERFDKWKLGERKVMDVLDYEKQTQSAKGKSKSTKDSPFQGLPRSNVLQFILEPEGKLTIRPSGTEPKIKLYVSLCHPTIAKTDKQLAQAKQELQDELASIFGQFIVHAGL